MRSNINMVKEKQLVEVARSFSYKLNLGNYQSADFFCSQKIECPENMATETSEKLYEFCKSEVMKSVDKYVEDKMIEAESKKVEAIIPITDKNEFEV